MVDQKSQGIDVRVLATEHPADGILTLTLGADDGLDLPNWTPGAHIELVLPSGLVRQYSLCGSPRDSTYTVSVLREPAGRGGSAEIHDTIATASKIRLRGPRNHFPFVPSSTYLFIAGGIGITPLLSMIQAAEESRAAWTLVYGGRSRSSMAFLDQLQSYPPGRVVLVPEDEQGRLELPAVLAAATTDTQIYCCGPGGLLDAVEARCAERNLSDRLHIERFAAPTILRRSLACDESFDVRLEQSGVTLNVSSDQSILDALEDADIEADYSCTEGFCGSCEVRVLAGRPDHRDSVATPEQHDSESTMMICVGRSKSPMLVLDL
jgi:ferredoxin-NADP reductase